jgi:hypothetical protein
MNYYALLFVTTRKIAGHVLGLDFNLNARIN